MNISSPMKPRRLVSVLGIEIVSASSSVRLGRCSPTPYAGRRTATCRPCPQRGAGRPAGASFLHRRDACPRAPALGGDGGGDMPPKDHPERGRRRTRTGPAKRRMRYPQHFMLRKVNNDTGEVLDLREWYGIHEIVHSSPKGAKEGTPECIIVLEDLRVAALNLLKGAGEKMPVDIVGSVEKDVRTIFEELYNWTLDIEKRHGFLSPLSMAARFLATGYGIRMVLTQPTAKSTEDDLPRWKRE